MNAFRNIVAYLNPSKPSSDAHEERSSSGRNEADSLSPHGGEEVHVKFMFILQFCTNITVAQETPMANQTLPRALRNRFQTRYVRKGASLWTNQLKDHYL